MMVDLSMRYHEIEGSIPAESSLSQLESNPQSHDSVSIGLPSRYHRLPFSVVSINERVPKKLVYNSIFDFC